jgi:hypothetical protein
MARRMTIELETVSGTVERFYVFVDGIKRIVADGTERASWSGDVPDDSVCLRIRVFGVGAAKYRFGIDLPGTADDQRIELLLDRGYGELELSL